MKQRAKIQPSNKKPVAGRKHYGNGLYLQTAESGSASWLLRYQRQGKERWMGLGPKRVFDVKQARARARAAQQQIYDDIDPLEARREQRDRHALEASRSISFAAAAEMYYAQHEAKWSNAKHRQAFLNTLKQHAYPVIGKLPVASIDTALVLKVLERDDLWTKKHQTASRVRGRIEAVLDWAKIRKYREGENPARWEGFLDQVLPAGPEIAKVVHHAALPYSDTPAFVTELRKRGGIDAAALEFLILCASRTGEVLHARWPELNLDERSWTIPPERMKGRKPHRVALSDRAIAILKSLPSEANNDLVFIGNKPGKPLDKMVMPRLVAAMGVDTTIHGFRATFRTWAAEQTAYPREVIEAALAHTTGSAVELAYQRSDVIEKRRLLMEAWSTFVSSPPVRKTGNITPIRKAGV
jgi:integrase